MPDEFVTVFADEHRQMREVLIDLIDALENQDQERAAGAIEAMERLGAPHFHHEQNELYPMLAEVHGDEELEALRQQLAEEIAAAAQLIELADQDSLDEEAANYGAELARQLLPHVAEPDEVALMVEVLEPRTKKELHKSHREAKKKGLSLKSVAKAAAKKPSGKKAPDQAPGKSVKAAAKRSAKPVRAKPTAKPATKRASRPSVSAKRPRKRSGK